MRSTLSLLVFLVSFALAYGSYQLYSPVLIVHVDRFAQRALGQSLTGDAYNLVFGTMWSVAVVLIYIAYLNLVQDRFLPPEPRGAKATES